jgi:hypothetical protein
MTLYTNKPTDDGENFYRPNSEYGRRFDRICKQQEWAPALATRILIAHALGLNHDYDRRQMELFIKYAGID